MNMIEMKDLTFSYQADSPAIKDVTLDVKKGEWLTILGHNGRGKRTRAVPGV